MVAFGEYEMDGTASAMKARDYKDATDLVFSNDPTATICANEAKTYTNEGSVFQLRNVIAEPIAIRTANTSSNGHGFSDETAYTLDRTQGQAIAQPIGFGMDGDVMHDNCMETITTREGAISDTSHAVAVDLYNQSVSDTNQTLSSSATDASHQGGVIVPNVSMAVRRLTPVECERLQGFPDNFTRIPWRNKPAEQCPDGPRYKALGNSMAVPVMRWIGERIQMFSEIHKDLNQQEAA
jgi:DNA (cytosine-5)-methyltransferase 1